MRQVKHAPIDRHAESALADRLMERDESALQEVMERYGTVVLGIARRVVAERSHAEEVAQDTFIALWRRPGAFDPTRGSLQSFLVGIARNKAIDLVRKEESMRRRADELMSEMATRPTTTTMDRLHDVADIQAALSQLPATQRDALALAYFGGRTYREVASELGIPEGTAKTRLRDGLIKMRETMTSRERKS
ncbi:MAG: RNA polymerase sigma factor [Actinomycetota bacterium]